MNSASCLLSMKLVRGSIEKAEATSVATPYAASGQNEIFLKDEDGVEYGAVDVLPALQPLREVTAEISQLPWRIFRLCSPALMWKLTGRPFSSANAMAFSRVQA